MKKLIGSNSEFLFVAKSLEQRVRKLDENEFKLPRPRCFFRKKKNVARSPLLCPPPPRKRKKKLTLDGSLLVHYKINLGEMVGI